MFTISMWIASGLILVGMASGVVWLCQVWSDNNIDNQ